MDTFGYFRVLLCNFVYFCPDYPEALEMFQEMSGNFRKCLGYGQEMVKKCQEMVKTCQEISGNVKKWSEIIRILSKIYKQTKKEGKRFCIRQA